MLAAAGLLDGYRVTMHWETIPSFVEQFPNVQVTDELFEIDRNRFTCAGGIAGYDMMLHMIRQQHGNELAVAVAEQFIHNRIRDPSEPQRIATTLRLATHHPLLIKVIQNMEQRIETPLTMGELVEIGGISRRQVDRLFQIHLRETPRRYYLKMRLRRARELLQQTSMSVLDIAVACGFIAPEHFSRAYSKHFARSPRADRKVKSYFALDTRIRLDEMPDLRASLRQR
jgi:transcriptional regulator GlxA family with amidase domain